MRKIFIDGIETAVDIFIDKFEKAVRKESIIFRNDFFTHLKNSYIAMGTTGEVIVNNIKFETEI